MSRKCGHTTKPRAEFEPRVAVFEREKAFRAALDRKTAVIIFEIINQILSEFTSRRHQVHQFYIKGAMERNSLETSILVEM
jgi:hypothetical protein